ncbi:hypothetical protein [Emticicia sp. C21]|uniref:hypothetical protein n=1 Tax=Emticicia sp. C21 TaxID=2302915 RepID=UPI000E343DDA|nr:hypothetical protein [Emticicia sp. C21]RFS15906.1 hypothetical protein D0T08_13445 [Emticicia sp. C21]
MKKLIIFSVFYLLILNPVFSQILTFKELMNLAKCRNHECFDNYILKKGFRFLKSEKSLSREISYNYISNDEFLATDSLVKNETGILFPNNLSVKTFFRTNITQQYQSILTQIKQSGFEADKTEFPKNGIRAYYFNSKMYGY